MKLTEKQEALKRALDDYPKHWILESQVQNAIDRGRLVIEELEGVDDIDTYCGVRIERDDRMPGETAGAVMLRWDREIDESRALYDKAPESLRANWTTIEMLKTELTSRFHKPLVEVVAVHASTPPTYLRAVVAGKEVYYVRATKQQALEASNDTQEKNLLTGKRPIEIWCEGYLCTGMEGIPAKARKLAIIEAESLDEAVQILKDRSTAEQAKYFTRYPDGRWAHWGCEIFDNEAAAREFLG